MRRLLPLVVAAMVAASVLGCDKVQVVNPFADIQTSPLETAIASSKAAIELGGEWYTDACVLRMPGLAANRDVCATYYDDVHPALQAAQKRAIKAALQAREDAGGLAKAATSVDGALRVFADFAVRYGFNTDSWAQGINLALGTLTQRLRQAAGGDA